MTKDEVLTLALEALEDACGGRCNAEYNPCFQREAITAIKEALKLAQEDAYTEGYRAGFDNGHSMGFTEGSDRALAQPEQTNTRPYYTIDELNAWADEKEKQAWRKAAIRIGEELSAVGPDGYYDMDAWKWLEWAMEQEPRGKNSLAQPDPYKQGYADAMNWKTANHLEHLPAAQPQRTVQTTLQERLRNSFEVTKLQDAADEAADKIDSLVAENEKLSELCTTPPQRTWVGLTDEHIERIYDRYGGDMMNCAGAIERELREMNNG